MRVDAEGEVAQHLRPKPVAQAYVFESDHAPLRAGSPQISAAGRRNRPESRFILAVDATLAEPTANALTVDSALHLPDLPIAGGLQVVPMQLGEAALHRARV